MRIGTSLLTPPWSTLKLWRCKMSWRVLRVPTHTPTQSLFGSNLLTGNKCVLDSAGQLGRGCPNEQPESVLCYWIQRKGGHPPPRRGCPTESQVQVVLQTSKDCYVSLPFSPLLVYAKQVEAKCSRIFNTGARFSSCLFSRSAGTPTERLNWSLSNALFTTRAGVPPKTQSLWSTTVFVPPPPARYALSVTKLYCKNGSAFPFKSRSTGAVSLTVPLQIK